MHKDGSSFYIIRVEDPNLIEELEAQNVAIKGEINSEGGGLLGTILGWILPMVAMLGLYYWMMNRMKGGGGLGAASFDRRQPVQRSTLNPERNRQKSKTSGQ